MHNIIEHAALMWEINQCRTTLEAHGVRVLQVHDSFTLDWSKADMRGLRTALPNGQLRSMVKSFLFNAEYGGGLWQNDPNRAIQGAAPFFKTRRAYRKYHRKQSRKMWNKLKGQFKDALGGLTSDQLIESLKKVRSRIQDAQK